MGDKIERKWLAHYIDANFVTSGTGTTNYVRLGQHLESYAEELNPQVSVQRNIIGEQTVIHAGYEVSSSVEPYYCYFDEPLFVKLKDIANKRVTGSDCCTTRVDVLFDESGNTLWAYREKCWVVPNSVGGDTSGMQIPFGVYNDGERTAGTWAKTGDNWTFTPTT